MRKMQRWRWMFALLTVVALLGAACGGGDDEPANGDTGAEEEEFEAGSTMAELQEKGTVTIGVKFDVPPFGFVRPGEDEPQGFDVDLGNIIADRLGVEAEFVEAISDNRIPFLKDGTVDLILSTMTITTDRDAEIDFSRPYFIAHQRLLVPGDSDIKTLDDLAGKTVCTVLGSTGEANLKDKAPDAKRRTVDAYSECLELVQNGAADAEISDDVILTGHVIQDDSLKLVGPELTTEPYGVGIPNDTPDMQEFIDGVLQDIFDSGEWDELYDEWVGQYTGQEPDHPSRLTLQDALDLFPCVEFC